MMWLRKELEEKFFKRYNKNRGYKVRNKRGIIIG